LRYNSPDTLLQVVVSILCSYAFFDDIKVLVFILYSAKKAITILESYSYTLANCFCELIYLKSYWTYRTFRELLLAEDDIFKKMSKSNISRHNLLYQMKLYFIRDPLFDILYSILETLLSRLSWLYRTKRNRLALHKIENMHKLASYHYSYAKQELLYFGVEKTNSEVFKILIDEYLNLDKDNFVEITEVDLNKSEENTNLSEESNLLINNILNLDKFENEFEEDNLSIDKDYYDEYREEISL
ncbi:5896_t:CDS:2, partial [Scutellospora calospora]